MKSSLQTLHDGIEVNFNIDHDEEITSSDLDLLLKHTPKLVNKALKKYNRKNKIQQWLKINSQ